MNTRRILSTTTCLLVLFVSNARAQQASGTYTTYIADRPVATENYRIASQPDGALRTEAEVAPAAAGAAQKATTVVSKNKPDSFSVEVGGAKVIEAKFGDGTVKLTVAGQTPRDVPTKATLVMENLIWHQFVFLLGQYDEAKGGRQEFTAFLPTRGVDYGVQIERLAPSVYKLKDRTATVRRYRVVAAGQLTLEMWVDEARVPLLLQVAAQQLKVIRQGSEALAEVAFAPPAGYKPPAYAVPSSFNEQEVTVGKDSEWPLPATLTMPVGKGAFPAVVLVHGSGANDRDETLAANKPFRDLAWGLASQGVAVLRYEKRTKQYGAKILAAPPNFTVKDETVDDALAAVALLRRTEGVDPKKIFVLGHSLGGALVPRIGAADSRIAGFVILAGATRPLEEEIVRQYEYLFALDGTVDDAERAQIDEIKRQSARVKALKAGDASGVILIGAPPSYWLDLRGYNPPAAARALKRPVLVLQGERDYNVTMDDFRNWHALTGKEVEFKSYPKLDHLFLEGEGAASDADYAQPRNVPKYVVDDIAAWVKKH